MDAEGMRTRGWKAKGQAVDSASRQRTESDPKDKAMEETWTGRDEKASKRAMEGMTTGLGQGLGYVSLDY